VRYEWDLRPWNAKNENTSGVKGGTFPYSVAMHGNVAYIGCDRDREVVVINTAGTGSFVGRVQLRGNPNGMAMSADGATLFVAQDNSDEVAAISTATNTVTRNIDTRGPEQLELPHGLTGVATTAVTISGDTLYAVNAGANSVAVIPLTGRHALTTTALLPTAYDPTDIAFSHDGRQMYIVNGKSDTGPNPGYGYGNTPCIQFFAYPLPAGVSPSALVNPGCSAAEQVTAAQQTTSYQNAVTGARLTDNNQYQFQLEHATLVSAPVPTGEDELEHLTDVVADNNGYDARRSHEDDRVMDFLHDHIKHVIYIVKENRTFDQILGDLDNGSNGDPSLTLFGKQVTPSFHRMAREFVTLDNFMDPGDGSMDGWSWSMRGRVTNTETITQQENYARVNRGLSYEGEGQNRNIPSNLNTIAQRDFFFDPTKVTTPYSTQTGSLSGGPANILAGDGDHAATDGPDGYQKGYIFNTVLDAGYTIRNYGWQANTPGSIGTKASPISDPFTAGVVQTTAANRLIATANGANDGTVVGAGFYDPYFRAYDQVYPDVWRANEFIRDVQANGLKNFSMIRGLSHDHTGSFGSALAGVDTPELQQADNDYAVGKVVEWIAHSKYAKDTLIFIIEDDSQDGADHVDSHRSTTYVVGPYVKRHEVIRTRYNQVNVLRTIEDIFGASHINLPTATARPMADVFDTDRDLAHWSFTAIASTLLKNTTLALADGDRKVEFAEGPDLKPTHDAAWWEEKTRGFDFSGEDRVPADFYNEILWEGLMGGKPYPVLHNNETTVTAK
jgi:YVTN family beta-propeller protein